MTERRLAAIMFTDIVGYTALMGENEHKALQLLETNRKIQKPLIEIYHGELLKEMGDGMLASFTSVSDAVHCAQEILKISKEEPDLKLHIGIHLGEVVFSDGDVFGDGVNIASRIESTAKEGEIYISEDVWKNIKNKEDLPVEFVGKKTFKNVKEPVGLYKIKELVSPVKSQRTKTSSISWRKIGIISTSIFILALAVYLLLNSVILNTSIQASDSPKSIALLPLQNISDEENDYLANGIQSQIATYLYKIPDLKVYEGIDIETLLAKNMTIDEISQELNLTHALEGSVFKEQNRFKLELKLEDLITGKVVTYSHDKNYDLLMDVISEVAEDLAQSIQIELGAEDKKRIETLPTPSPEAYQLNMKARQLGMEAKEIYAKTGKIPYNLADSARDIALKALEYDPDYLDPQLIILEYETYIGNFDKAMNLADNMIKNHPNRFEPYEHAGELMMSRNNYNGALEYYKQSLERDPSVLHVNRMVGGIYCYIKNDYVNGIPYLALSTRLEQAVKSPYGASFYYYVMIEVYRSIGHYEKAMEWTRRWLKHESSCAAIYNINWNYSLQGETKKAATFLDSICGKAVCDDCNWLYFYQNILDGNPEQALQHTPLNNSYWDVQYLNAYFDIKAGNREEGLEKLHALKNELEEFRDQMEWEFKDWQFSLAMVYDLLGEKEKALELLKACEERGFWYGSHDYMMVGPVFENLKTDPEFIGIYQRAQKETAEIRAKIREMEEQGELNL